MAIQIALNHKTHYRYDRPVTLGPQIVRLRPAPHCRTPILSYSLKIHPDEHFLNWQQDPQANYLARLVFPNRPPNSWWRSIWSPKWRSSIRSISSWSPTRRQCPFPYDDASARELRPFLETELLAPALEPGFSTVPREPVRTIDFLISLNQRLQGRDRLRDPHGARSTNLRADAHARHAVRAAIRRGCWSQILRNLGLARALCFRLSDPARARRETARRPRRARPPTSPTCTPGPKSTCPAPDGSDSIPPPACSPAKDTSRSPARPTPASAAPISGLLESCKTDVQHEMSVQRIHESPRVTKPYTEEQWNEILALGHQVDVDLKAGDVRLTMGGEPTFISLDDRQRTRVDHHRLRARKAKAVRGTLPAVARSVRARRAAAFRAGQMVSRASRFPAGR